MKGFLWCTVAIAVLVVGSCTEITEVGVPERETAAADSTGSVDSQSANDTTPVLDWKRIGIATGGPCDPSNPIIPCEPCPDPDQEALVQDYQNAAQYGQYPGIHPQCDDFTTSGGSTHFSWSELNGGWSTGNPHQGWGMIDSSLPNALEATRTNYNRGGILLTSGYRCPHGNASLNGASPTSLHMHGRAADMYSADHVWTEQEFNLLKVAAEATVPAPTESFSWNTYTDHHYHVAW